MGEWLDMSISDDRQGVPATEVERVFFAVRPRVHALSLLRRRLQGLFGRSFKLEVRSDIGRGTTVTMRIPLRTPLSLLPKSFATVTSEPDQLLSR
jgi:LytS/YehU family sensor histidine kinase